MTVQHSVGLLRDQRGAVSKPVYTTMVVAAALAAGLSATRIVESMGWTQQNVANRAMCWLYTSDSDPSNDGEYDKCMALEKEFEVDPSKETFSWNTQSDDSSAQMENAARLGVCDSVYSSDQASRSKCNQREAELARSGVDVSTPTDPKMTPAVAANRAYRGQIGGLGGYNSLCHKYQSSRNEVLDTIIRKTGLDPGQRDTLDTMLSSECQ